MKERQSPQALAKKLAAQAPQILDALPAMPMLVHQYLKEAPHRAQLSQPDNGSTRKTIAGSVLIMAASLILAAAMMSKQSVIWYFVSFVPIVIGLVFIACRLTQLGFLWFSTATFILYTNVKNPQNPGKGHPRE